MDLYGNFPVTSINTQIDDEDKNIKPRSYALAEEPLLSLESGDENKI